MFTAYAYIYKMDSNCVFLSVRKPLNQFARFKIENVSLETSVKSFKEEAAKKICVKNSAIELTYCGLILDDESTLSACGIKPGVTIHVLPKKPEPKSPSNKFISEVDVQQLVNAFRAFKLSPGFRAALHRLSRPEVLESILNATPGLSDDPIAISIIQDPELIAHMSDPDTVRRVAKQHPSLIEAVSNLATHIQDNSIQDQAGPSSGYSYSLEALSDDDEDMDSSSGGDLSRNPSYNAITAAHLAAAIANATGQSRPATGSGGVITSEMFSSAIQQAFASSGAETSAESPLRRYQAQLQQMREIGLSNEGVNLRALQATSGDVQAAIELVFNGVID